MRCILVFDALNDIVYTKYDQKFTEHIVKYAKTLGLISEEEKEDNIPPNIIMQLFSPIVTSQRIMNSQFGNSYTSCQCHDGLNVVFKDYVGFIFLSIGNEDVDDMTRMLNVCVTFVRYLCGPDLSLLQNGKTNTGIPICETLTKLLNTWLWHQRNDQSMLVESIEQLQVSNQLSVAILHVLQESVDRLKTVAELSKMHCVLFVHNKFLSLYSSRNAQELSAGDIMFASMVCASLRRDWDPYAQLELNPAENEQFFSPCPSPQSIGSAVYNLQVLVSGTNADPNCLPHVLFVAPLSVAVHLAVLVEQANPALSSGLHESFLYLAAVQTVQVQRDPETLRPAIDNLDLALRKVHDGIKKNKNPTVEHCHKRIVSQWDIGKKKYQEFLKTGDEQCLMRGESATSSIRDPLRQLLGVICFDGSAITAHAAAIVNLARVVDSRLSMLTDFLHVKAMNNFSLGSKASITVNKYVEEFPGMVHFIYIDRSTHRVTTPSLDFSSRETLLLTKRMIWSMVHFSRRHLTEGHLSLIWKDTIFNYCYLLWFEDRAGSPLKPKVFPTSATRVLPQPGVLCTNFYRKLVEVCFPRVSVAKVRCYELFCIHLGLATSGCVLEQTRRLAATICDVTGVHHIPFDLL